MEELLALQCGVISRRQAMECGLADHDIKRMLRTREWAVVHPGVYVDHTGQLTWKQRAWAAVLYSWPAALCDESALRAVEGPGKRGREQELIHVAVARERARSAPPGVRLHRTARLSERVQWNASPPRFRYEEAAIDVAMRMHGEFEAIAVLADAVQGRRTTAGRMRSALAGRPWARRRGWLDSVLRDIADGTCSVLEHGYLARVERAHGLPRADRQVEDDGIYRDVEYAQGLVIELDGRLFHDSARARDRDLDRDLRTALDGRATVRCSWGQVFGRPCQTAALIATLLRQRGWDGSPGSCGPTCVVTP